MRVESFVKKVGQRQARCAPSSVRAGMTTKPPPAPMSDVSAPTPTACAPSRGEKPRGSSIAPSAPRTARPFRDPATSRGGGCPSLLSAPDPALRGGSGVARGPADLHMLTDDVTANACRRAAASGQRALQRAPRSPRPRSPPRRPRSAPRQPARRRRRVDARRVRTRRVRLVRRDGRGVSD
jgi:hypothetical protein